jgi:hypothetical protein
MLVSTHSAGSKVGSPGDVKVKRFGTLFSISELNKLSMNFPIKQFMFLILAVGHSYSIAQTKYKNLVSIRFLDDTEAHSVGYGKDKRERPVFDPVPHGYNKDSLQRIIYKELDKYPLSVLQNKVRLGEIVLCDGVWFNDEKNEPTIRFSGTFLGPTRIGNVVFLDVATKSLPRTLHHEISSLLIEEMIASDSAFSEKYRKTEAYFRKVTSYWVDSPAYDENKPGFPANVDNKLVLGSNGYAQTDFENDYNTIAESLFASKNALLYGSLLVEPKGEFWEFLSRAKSREYPVYEKVMMMVDLYGIVDPVFTLEYFKRVSQE